MDRSRAEGLKKKKKEGEEIGEQVNSDHSKWRKYKKSWGWG